MFRSQLKCCQIILAESPQNLLKNATFVKTKIFSRLVTLFFVLCYHFVSAGQLTAVRGTSMATFRKLTKIFKLTVTLIGAINPNFMVRTSIYIQFRIFWGMIRKNLFQMSHPTGYKLGQNQVFFKFIRNRPKDKLVL